MPRKDPMRPLRRVLNGVVQHTKQLFPDIELDKPPTYLTTENIPLIIQTYMNSTVRYIHEGRYEDAAYMTNEMLLILARLQLSIHQEMGAKPGRLVGGVNE